MTAFGEPIGGMDRVSSSGPVVLYTMESSRTTEGTAWATSRIAMDHPTQESGKTTRKKAREHSNGSVELPIPGLSVMIRCTEMEYTHGNQVLNFRVSGDITRKMARERCNIRMVASTKGLGKTTSVMEMDVCDGRMVRHMKANSQKTLSTVVAFTLGPTSASTTEIGTWANEQVQEKLLILMALNTMGDSKIT